MMLLLAAAVFAGSSACRPCHSAIAAAYERTPMARSTGMVDSVPPAEFTAAGHRYRIADNRLHFSQGSVAFDYFVGSNAAGRSFLFQREGYLYELPVTWYSQKRLWDASPGYERETEVRLNRPIDATCLWCHASRVRPVLGTQNRYGDPPFLENGIACERCHGPGSEHVRDPASARMVNPAKLKPDRRDSVCIQCHLTGGARIERPARRFSEFRAGDKLADLVTYLVWNLDDEGLKVTSHVERLAKSKCKLAAGDKLWCGTCHEPHTNSSRTQQACLGCHASAHHREDRCATCHMPRTTAVDAGHGELTDHRIPRLPTRPAAPRDRPALIAFLGTADDRSLGLAYSELEDPRAREYLLRAPADTETRLHLATLEKDPKRAAALYEAVLRADPSRPAALVNLGVIYARSGHVDQAAGLWERALQTNPAIEGAALNLAQIRPPAEARVILNRYLEFNPGSLAVRKRLAEIPER
jgi:tetratricopeptide (TPR) repeat protein